MLSVNMTKPVNTINLDEWMADPQKVLCIEKHMHEEDIMAACLLDEKEHDAVVTERRKLILSLGAQHEWRYTSGTREVQTSFEAPLITPKDNRMISPMFYTHLELEAIFDQPLTQGSMTITLFNDRDFDHYDSDLDSNSDEDTPVYGPTPPSNDSATQISNLMAPRPNQRHSEKLHMRAMVRKTKKDIRAILNRLPDDLIQRLVMLDAHLRKRGSASGWRMYSKTVKWLSLLEELSKGRLSRLYYQPDMDEFDDESIQQISVSCDQTNPVLLSVPVLVLPSSEKLMMHVSFHGCLDHEVDRLRIRFRFQCRPWFIHPRVLNTNVRTRVQLQDQLLVYENGKWNTDNTCESLPELSDQDRQDLLELVQTTSKSSTCLAIIGTPEHPVDGPTTAVCHVLPS